MSNAFVDTSGWASAFVRTETFYVPAAAHLRQWQADGTRVLTTNYVLTELAALLTSPLRVLRPQQIIILNAIREAAWTLFQQRPDKLWSLVDCASFVVMQQHNITEALTTDHHFEQAGLMRLLK